MDDIEKDELLAAVFNKPANSARLLAAADLTDAEREELEKLVETANAVWLAAYEPPTLAEDPVAVMLGLVPSPQSRLDQRAFINARKAAGLKAGDVAARLTSRGWTFTTRDVARWELQSANDVPPAVIEALADIVNAPPERLLASAPASHQTSAFTTAKESPRFADLAARWAELFNLSVSTATRQLELRSLTTVHRGSEPDVEQLLSSLGALVDAAEKRESAQS